MHADSSALQQNDHFWIYDGLYCFILFMCSAQEFCSVGDDSCLILWDARSGSTPAVKVIVLHIISIHFSI